MNKLLYFLLLATFVISGCKKESPPPPPPDPPDTAAPVITLTGSPSTYCILNTTYVDSGATAWDAKDGALTVIVSGTVNKDLAGVYTITYSATDAAGNYSMDSRTVTVYNEADAHFTGTYTSASETDALGPYTYQTSVKPFIVSASYTVNNRVHMNRLGDIDNNTVYMDITGTTLSIPSQLHTNVGTGSASCQVHDRQTDGTGVKTAGGFNLTYNDAKIAHAYRRNSSIHKIEMFC